MARKSDYSVVYFTANGKQFGSPVLGTDYSKFNEAVARFNELKADPATAHVQIIRRKDNHVVREHMSNTFYH